MAEDLRKEFRTKYRYTVHWDGKVLCDISEMKTVDRIAILLFVNGVDQLLGVPKADGGTAHQKASAVISILNQWNVAPYVKTICFDTPLVNTDIKRRMIEAINSQPAATTTNQRYRMVENESGDTPLAPPAGSIGQSPAAPGSMPFLTPRSSYDLRN
ncbi:hypothetical protein EVAR_16235_1 [Eumeta japonica]|uniref:Uncharacterized protein n=1 Tax=Eumeta variegata TaxID=151549 RepID=A0A4C1U6G2_EUMVA|nr:hypothetical protein EVAR_16235_1 [Eumeta japonica]